MRLKKLLLLVVIFIAGLLVAERYSRELFFLMNCTPDQALLRLLMLSLTQLADGSWVMIIAILLFPRRPGLILAVVLAFLISGIIVQAFKSAWPQPRPTVLFRALEMLCLPGLRNTNSSFPSGHAAAALVLARFLAEGGSRRQVALMLFVGSLMAFSRVYVGVHFTADVWAGGWLGWFVCDATLRFFRHKKPLSDYFLRGALASALGFLLTFYFIFWHPEKIPHVDIFFEWAAGILAVVFTIRMVYYAVQWWMDRSIRSKLAYVAD